mmetsp:Transcript_28419/g.76979  ORF Transcript_28419/g.76979 Transcript_28419/m.76979 type:complete len:919 (-) Transcript_28419:323-3079(-)
MLEPIATALSTCTCSRKSLPNERHSRPRTGWAREAIDRPKQNMVSASLSNRISRKRSHRFPSHCSFPIYIYITLWIWLVAINDCGTHNIWVRAQSNNDDFDCYDDIYESDRNGDGKVDSQEYVDFFRLRLEHRRSDEGSIYDGSQFKTFQDVPFPLQSNFYALSCFCTRFQFEDDDDFDDFDDFDRSTCCVGNNAHIAVVTAGSALGVDDTMTGQELTYVTLVCDLTQRAINDAIETMETIPPLPTDSPTDSPTTAAPTSRPTKRPTTRPTETPTETSTSSPPSTSPTSKPSIPATTPSTLAPSSFSSPSSSSLSSPQHVSTYRYFTVKTVYSIIVEDNGDQGDTEQQKQSVTIEPPQESSEPERKSSVEEHLIEAMDVLAQRVAFGFWFQGMITPSIFYDSLFAVFPTAIDSRVDVGFTSSPELTEMDRGSASDNSKDTVFVGGPCPAEMMTSQPEIQNDRDDDSNKSAKPTQLYRCEEVTASIVLELRMNPDDMDGNSVDNGFPTMETIEDLYSEALESEILNGHLADNLGYIAPNSMATIATGQIVSVAKPTSKLSMRVGILAAIVAAGLFLIMIIVQFTVWAKSRKRRLKGRKRVGHNRDSTKKQTDIFTNPSDERDSAEERKKASSEKVVDSDQQIDLETGQNNLTDPATYAVGVAAVAGANQSANDDVDVDVDSRVINSVPYFPSSPGSIASSNPEDARSTGGISQESDAGWSETYTSSMGSLSEDDALSLPELSSGTATTLIPLGTEPVSPASRELTPGDNSYESSPTKVSQTYAANDNTTSAVVAEVEESQLSPPSSTPPGTLKLLEQTVSDNEDDFIIHEDSSDDDEVTDIVDDGDKIDNAQNGVSREKQPLLPSEFRSKVLELVERVVPEELDQIDDMIAQFKNRESELIDTLLAMEKRASSQQKDEQ